MKKLFTILVFCLSLGWTSQVLAQYQLVVAADGSGNYTSINAAISAAVEAFGGGFEGRVRIFVKNGVYNEKVMFGSHNTGKTLMPVSIVGESRDGVIIQNGNYQTQIDNTYPDKKEGSDYYYGTAQCATMTINSEDFYGENFTIINTKDTTVYTTGLYIAGRRQAYKNIKVNARRGTLFIRNGRPAFVMDSYFEGNQEMTASNGTAVIYNSTFKIKGSNAPYSIPEDNIYYDVPVIGDTIRYGHIFRNCSLVAMDTTTAGTIFLATPKARESSAWFMNCKLGAHINPVGIKASSNTVANSRSYFGEYKSVMADGTTPADVSQRATNVRQMSDAYVSKYAFNNHIYNKMFGANEAAAYAAKPDTVYWNPLKLVAPLGIPQNVAKSGSNLTWNVVEGAIGYVVYLDGAYAGMTDANSFSSASGSGTYTVCSVSESGSMSKPSGTATQQNYQDLVSILNNIPVGIKSPNSTIFSLFIVDKSIRFETETDCKIFNLSGQCILSRIAQTEISLQSLPKGIYLVKTKDSKYGNNITKVVL